MSESRWFHPVVFEGPVWFSIAMFGRCVWNCASDLCLPWFVVDCFGPGFSYSAIPLPIACVFCIRQPLFRIRRAPVILQESGAADDDGDEPSDNEGEGPSDPPPAAPGLAAGSGNGASASSASRVSGERKALKLDNGGAIKFYKTARPFFEFICGNKAHGKCVMTRSACAAEGRRGKPGQGRCLGLGAAWLSDNFQADHEAHMAFAPDVDERIVARIGFREQYGDEFLRLEALEREPREGEDEEPEQV